MPGFGRGAGTEASLYRAWPADWPSTDSSKQHFALLVLHIFRIRFCFSIESKAMSEEKREARNEEVVREELS